MKGEFLSVIMSRGGAEAEQYISPGGGFRALSTSGEFAIEFITCTLVETISIEVSWMGK